MQPGRLDNQMRFPDRSGAPPSAPIECRRCLGGMLKCYHRQAATASCSSGLSRTAFVGFVYQLS